jgi:hypothetical protein
MTSRQARKQGSAFYELIVLPTFAPRLARPYRVPGTDRVYNQEFAALKSTRGHRRDHALDVYRDKTRGRVPPFLSFA